MTPSAPTRQGLNFTLGLAWAIETFAIGIGFYMAFLAGYEGSGGGSLISTPVVTAALPFVALGLIEMAKIPVVRMIFTTRSSFRRGLALFVVVVVAGASFVDFVMAFERSYNERIQQVVRAEHEVQSLTRERDIATTKVPQLTVRQGEITDRLAALREEVGGIRQQARADIDDAKNTGALSNVAGERSRIDAELREIDLRRDGEVARERARCSANRESLCRLSIVASSYNRQHESLAKRASALLNDQRRQEATMGSDMAQARTRRDADLANRDRERQSLEAELGDVRAQLVAAQATALVGTQRVADAELRRDEKIEQSQVHRLADFVYGNHDPSSAQKTKTLLVTVLATIVALIGSVVSGLHYGSEKEREAGPSTRRDGHGIARNLRGWLARRRRSHLPVAVREVVKEVPVDRLALIYVPLDVSEEEVARIRREHGILAEAA